MNYRIFVLDREDQATELVTCEAGDDLEALAKAREIAPNCYAVEVWKQGRLVDRLGGEVT